MSSSIYISRIIMIETPATAKIPARPIRCHQTGDFDRAVNDYANRTNDGKMHSESLLSPIANSVIQLDSTPERIVDLPGGHDESRFVVLIEAVENSGTRTERVTYISGYTDHFDYVNAPGDVTDVAKDMQIYFNGTVSATRTARRGGGAKISLTDTSQILTSPVRDLDDLRTRRGRKDELQLLTPSSVTHLLSQQAVADNFGTDYGNVRDTRTSLGVMTVMRSRRDNNCPSTYMSRILGGYDQSRLASKDDVVNLKTFGEMQAMVSDSPVQNSVFFRRLIEDGDFVEDGYVTWRSLTTLFPEIRRNKLLDVILLDKKERVVNWRDCENMSSEMPEALIANMIVASLPPMFMDLMFDEVDITITNDTDDGKTEVTIHGYYSFFEGIDFIQNLDTLEHRIKFWVIEGQWFTNTLYHITGVISARGISNLEVSYDDEDSIPYTYASFADASASSMLSSKEDALKDIAGSLGRLIEVIDERFDRHKHEELILPDSVKRSRDVDAVDDTDGHDRRASKPSLIDRLTAMPAPPPRSTPRDRASNTRASQNRKFRM